MYSKAGKQKLSTFGQSRNCVFIFCCFAVHTLKQNGICKLLSKIRKKGSCPATITTPVYVMLRLPPGPGFENGAGGELCSKTNLLEWQNK